MKLNANKKKGFTLVEIIVVLVILAILAAATVPAMLGFVGKARESEETANARAVFLATQTFVTEEIATNDTCDNATATGFADKVKTLSEVEFTTFAVTMDGDKIGTVTYSTDKYDVLIEADKSVTLTKK